MRLVREYINEKFTEDSDPIADLGIGTFGFGNIKVGDIVQCTKEFGVTYGGLLRKMNFNGENTSNLYNNYGVIVKKLRNKNKLTLYIAFWSTISNLKEFKKEVLSKQFNLKNNNKIVVLYSTEYYRTWAEHLKIANI